MTADTRALAASAQFMRASERLPRLLDLTAEDIRILSDFEMAYEQEPPDEAALARIAAEFEHNQALVIQKTEHYLHVLDTLKMLREAYKARADALSAKADSAKRTEERLKERLLQAMKAMQRDRIDTPSGTLSIRANPPKVEILEQEMVPREFIKIVVTTTVDKSAVLTHFKASGEIPEGIAITRGERVQVS